MDNELLTVEELKTKLRNDLSIKEYNRDGMIKYAGFLIVCDLENEIKQKNNFRKKTSNSYLDSREYEKFCDLEFMLNCGVLNFYREVKKIFFVKNTSENRKKYFDFETMNDFINKGKSLYNYEDWYIKIDEETQKPIDITTAGAINNIKWNKDFNIWMAQNYKYYINYNAYNLAKNLDSIIDELLKEFDNIYIKTTCKLKDGSSKEIFFKKYDNSKYNYNKILYQALENKTTYYNINDIISCSNDSIPLFYKSDKINVENIYKNDDLMKKISVVYNDYKFHKYHEIKILNTNIYIEIEKKQNYFILSYNNNRYKFYKINNNLYMYETECSRSIIKISLNRLIKGEKTRNLIRDILKAITE